MGIYYEAQRESPRVVCGVEKKYGEEYGKEDQRLCSDNVGEYTSDSFLQLCRDEGITRHFTLRKHRNKTGWLKG